MDKLTLIVTAAHDPQQAIQYRIIPAEGARVIAPLPLDASLRYFAHARCLSRAIDRSGEDNRREPLGCYKPKSTDLCRICNKPLWPS